MATRYDIILIGGVIAVAGIAYVSKWPPFDAGGIVDKLLAGEDPFSKEPEEDEEVPAPSGKVPAELQTGKPFFDPNTGKVIDPEQIGFLEGSQTTKGTSAITGIKEPQVKPDPTISATFQQELWKQIYFPYQKYPFLYQQPYPYPGYAGSDPFSSGQPGGLAFGFRPPVQGGDLPPSMGVGTDPHLTDQLCQLYNLCPPGGDTHTNLDDYYFDSTNPNNFASYAKAYAVVRQNERPRKITESDRLVMREAAMLKYKDMVENARGIRSDYRDRLQARLEERVRIRRLRRGRERRVI